MRKTSRIWVLALTALGIWLEGCSAAKSTPPPTSRPTPVTRPTAKPTPSAAPTVANRPPVLEGAYLGQPRPGLTPEPFAAHILSDDGDFDYHLHTSVYFSSDSQEVYFTHQTLEPLRLMILSMRQENGAWSQPQVAPFSGTYDDNCAAFSADGQRFYFTSNRPLGAGGEPEEESNIWFVERTGAGWSEPGHVRSPMDIDRDEGPLYFSAALEGGRGSYDVYRSRFVDGRYTAPENLGEPVNTDLAEYVVLTAPDERFLILYRFDRADKAGSGLYVSLRLPGDAWTEPVYMDDELGLDFGFDASLSPDGKYLFLLDRGVGVYWVDAQVIEEFVMR